MEILKRRTAADKVIRNKGLKMLKIQHMMDININLLQQIFDQKLPVQHLKMKLLSELSEQLHQPIIMKFEKRKVHSSFIDNIWGPVPADLLLISKFNKGFQFLKCVVSIYIKYAWVITVKDKKVTIVNNDFQNKFK